MPGRVLRIGHRMSPRLKACGIMPQPQRDRHQSIKWGGGTKKGASGAGTGAACQRSGTRYKESYATQTHLLCAEAAPELFALRTEFDLEQVRVRRLVVVTVREVRRLRLLLLVDQAR